MSTLFSVIGSQGYNLKSISYFLSDNKLSYIMSDKEILSYFKSPINKIKQVIRGNLTSNYSVGLVSEECSLCPIRTGIPELLYNVSSEMKIIYVIGDPIDRFLYAALSVYSEDEIFDKYAHISEIDMSDKILVSGLYNYQLSQYSNYFPDSQIYIIFAEDFEQDKEAGLSNLLASISNDPVNISNINLNRISIITMPLYYIREHVKYNTLRDSLINIYSQDIDTLSTTLSINLRSKWGL